MQYGSAAPQCQQQRNPCNDTCNDDGVQNHFLFCVETHRSLLGAVKRQRTSAGSTSPDILMPTISCASHQETEQEANLRIPQAALAQSQLPSASLVAK